jgi:hypothetical protein
VSGSRAPLRRPMWEPFGRTCIGRRITRRLSSTGPPWGGSHRS